jgi:hypothetical protein
MCEIQMKKAQSIYWLAHKGLPTRERLWDNNVFFNWSTFGEYSQSVTVNFVFVFGEFHGTFSLFEVFLVQTSVGAGI